MPRPTDIGQIMELIEEDPIAGAAAAQQFCDGVQRRTYEGSAAAFKLAKVLQASTALRTAFYKDPFWSEGYQKNVTHTLLHCHQYLYRARDGRDGRRAEDHARAAQPVFDDGVTVAEAYLRMLIEDGGFDSLKKAATRGRRSAGGDGLSPAETQVGHSEETPNPTPVHATATMRVAPERKREAQVERPETDIRWSSDELAKRLIVDMSSDELYDFLAENSRVGDEAILYVARDPDAANDMTVWRATAIDWATRPKREVLDDARDALRGAGT